MYPNNNIYNYNNNNYNNNNTYAGQYMSNNQGPTSYGHSFQTNQFADQGNQAPPPYQYGSNGYQAENQDHGVNRQAPMSEQGFQMSQYGNYGNQTPADMPRGRQCYRCIGLYAFSLLATIAVTCGTIAGWEKLPTPISTYGEIYVAVKSGLYFLFFLNVLIKNLCCQICVRWLLLILAILLTFICAIICYVAIEANSILSNICNQASTYNNSEANSVCSGPIAQLENYLWTIMGLSIASDFVLPVITYKLSVGFKEHLRKQNKSK